MRKELEVLNIIAGFDRMNLEIIKELRKAKKVPENCREAI
jgi:hypothetical protein